MLPGRVRYESCPLCGGEETVTVRESACDWHALYKEGLGASMRWLGCVVCGHVFVDGYFNEAARELLFTGTHDAQRPGVDVEGQRQMWAPTVERVTRQVAHPLGGWLDVGLGSGSTTSRTSPTRWCRCATCWSTSRTPERRWSGRARS